MLGHRTKPETADLHLRPSAGRAYRGQRPAPGTDAQPRGHSAHPGGPGRRNVRPSRTVSDSGHADARPPGAAALSRTPPEHGPPLRAAPLPSDLTGKSPCHRDSRAPPARLRSRSLAPALRWWSTAEGGAALAPPLPGQAQKDRNALRVSRPGQGKLCPGTPPLVGIIKKLTGPSNGTLPPELLHPFLPPTPVSQRTIMSIPDYMTNPDAVLQDDVAWRHKMAPNYKKTREFYNESTFYFSPRTDLLQGCGDGLAAVRSYPTGS